MRRSQVIAYKKFFLSLLLCSFLLSPCQVQASYAAVFPAIGRATAITIQTSLGLLLIYLALGDKSFRSNQLIAVGPSSRGLYDFRQERIRYLHNEINVLASIKKKGPQGEREIYFFLQDHKKDLVEEVKRQWAELYQAKAPMAEKDFTLWRINRYNIFLEEAEGRQRIWNYNGDLEEWRLLVESALVERHNMLKDIIYKKKPPTK